jgi:kynureninase
VSPCARSLAEARDASDALQGFRGRFALPRGPDGAPLTYLAGHSLGLLPLAARELVNEELDDWASLGVLGHERARRPWIPYHENLSAGLASLAGAFPDEVIAMNSLTVNLHLMLASFYRPQGRRNRIVIEAGAFSSDRHAVASQIAWWGRGCSFVPVRPSISRAWRVPLTATAVWRDSTWRTPSATCHWPCMMRMPISPCGAATST